MWSRVLRLSWRKVFDVIARRLLLTLVLNSCVFSTFVRERVSVFSFLLIFLFLSNVVVHCYTNCTEIIKNDFLLPTEFNAG